MIINGEESELISVNDRGLQFGDGLFETMRVINNEPQDLDLHLTRIHSGCKRLQIPFPTNWHQEIINACKHKNHGILKIILTRGESKQGLKVSNLTPNRIIKVSSLPAHIAKLQQQGVKLKVCNTRLSCNPATMGLKSLSWLENVLAHLELRQDFHEGLMLNIQDEVIEGISSNFFAIKARTLITPDLNNCGLKGITRAKVLKLASELGLKTLETKITNWHNFDACFITNSVIGLYPVVAIEQCEFPLSGLVGKLQQRLI